MALRHILALIGLFHLSSAYAVEADKELVERARASQAMSLQFMAADLLDELVYRWTQNPPLPATGSRVVVMPLMAPIGLNSHMNAFLENHLFSLLTKHPQASIRPVYCGPCLAMTSYSRNDRTIVARGADIHELGSSFKEQADAALYVSFEAEGSQLMLRSYFASLKDQRILAAQSLATDSSHPPLLRSATRLASIEQTRQEYVHILEARKRISVMAGIRGNFINAASDTVLAPPFAWAYLGFETFVNDRKKWLADIVYAAAYLENQYSAWQLSSRVYRHVSSDSVNLVSPDVYLWTGFSYWEIKGPTAQLFTSKKKLTPGDIVLQAQQRKERPKAHNLGATVGIEARIAEFIRGGVFIESFANQQNNESFEGVGAFHSWGFEFGVTL